MQPMKLDYADNIFWVYGVVLNSLLGDAKSFMKELAENSIGTRPFFSLLYYRCFHLLI